MTTFRLDPNGDYCVICSKVSCGQETCGEQCAEIVAHIRDLEQRATVADADAAALKAEALDWAAWWDEGSVASENDVHPHAEEPQRKFGNEGAARAYRECAADIREMCATEPGGAALLARLARMREALEEQFYVEVAHHPRCTRGCGEPATRVRIAGVAHGLHRATQLSYACDAHRSDADEPSRGEIEGSAQVKAMDLPPRAARIREVLDETGERA